MSDFKPLTPRSIRDLVGYGEASPDPRWPGGAPRLCRTQLGHAFWDKSN